jgi:hypothetical protein
MAIAEQRHDLFWADAGPVRTDQLAHAADRATAANRDAHGVWCAAALDQHMSQRGATS